MGEPEFKLRPLLRRHHVAVISSNYALDGDLSDPVMITLESVCPHVEPYSIDEAFLRLDGALKTNAATLAAEVRELARRFGPGVLEEVANPDGSLNPERVSAVMRLFGHFPPEAEDRDGA